MCGRQKQILRCAQDDSFFDRGLETGISGFKPISRLIKKETADPSASVGMTNRYV
jgi:hypothetical protein